MKLNIFAKNIKLTEGINGAIEEKLNFLSKFLKEETPVSITIKVEKETHSIKIVTTYQKQIIEIEESSNDLYISIDKIAEVLKFKISKMHDCSIDKKRHSVGLEIHEESYEPVNKSKITKRKSFQMKPMSEQEAILQMEMLEHPSFMFINTDLDFVMCLIYKKKDNTYGIIEGLLDEDDE